MNYQRQTFALSVLFASFVLIGVQPLSSQETGNDEEQQSSESTNGQTSEESDLEGTNKSNKELPELRVTEPQREGYVTKQTSTATRTTTPIDETPFSIQSVPRQVIDDQEATQLSEITRNVSSVFESDPFFGSQRFNIRGFKQTTQLRNGFRDGLLFTNRTKETANIERLEVLKGPASVLHGRLQPGGVVSIITEKPTETPHYRTKVRGGSEKFAEGQIDFSGPLNDSGTVLYRLNALYEQRDGFREPFEQDFEKAFVAPVITWNISDDTLLRLDFEYTDEERPLDRGIVAIGNEVADIPFDRNLQEPGDFVESEQIYASYTFKHRFNQNFKLRNRFQFFQLDTFDISNDPFGTVDSSGNLGRFVFSNDRTATTVASQTNLIGNFRTGTLDHKVMAGVDYNYANDDKIGRTTDAGFGVTSINIFDPVYDDGTPDRSDLDFMSNDDDDTTDSTGVYLQDQISLRDRWHLLVGGRVDNVNQESVDKLSDTTTRQDDEEISPRVGLLYKASERASVYGSYSESFVPNTASRADGSILDPEEGKQYEVGVKTSWLDDRLSATVAAFDITKENVATTDPNNPNFSIPVGEEQSQGIELDVSGDVTDRIQIIGSYSFLDTEVTEDNGPNEGNELPNVPTHGASLWGTYEVNQGTFEGLKFGSGLFYVGDREGNLANDFELDRYLRTDASLSYTFSSWKAKLTLKNLFDTDYITSNNFGQLVQPGKPFTAIFTIDYNFQ